MANPRELWYYFEDMGNGLVKCNLCRIKIDEPESVILRIMQNHIKLYCKRRGEVPSDLYPPVPYKLRKYYTSSDGIATCNKCGHETTYTESYKLFTHNKKCEHSKWERESQHEPSTSTTMATAMGSSAECQQLSFDSSSLQSRLHNPIPSTSTGYRGSSAECQQLSFDSSSLQSRLHNPIPSTSTGYRGSSAGHQIQEQSISPRQESIDMNEVFKKSIRSLAKLYSQPVPSPEQTKKTPGAVDTPRTSASTVSNIEGVLSDFKRINKAVKAVKAERSASGEYSPPVQLFEQTTKDSGDDVDAVELQNLEWSATPTESVDLDEIEKFIEGFIYVSQEHSPPVPSPEQTTKNPDAVDTPCPSTTTGYGSPSAGHQIQEQSISLEQESIDTNELWKKIIRNAAKPSSQPVPSPEQTKKTPGAVDTPRTSASTVTNMGFSAERRIQEQPSKLKGLLSNLKRVDKAVKAVKAERSASGEYSPPVQSLEQTTKDPGAVDNSKTSSSKDYDVDTFVEPQTSERSVTNEQELENLDKINRTSGMLVQSILSVIKENSPSVPSPQPGFSTAEEYDMNPSERENDDRTRSEEQPDSQVLSSEQTTRNPGAVDTSTTSSSKDVDEFVHPQTPEVLKPVTGEEHLADLYKIDKLIEETEETRRRDSTIPSPSVPSREYDRDSSERRSGEQPDSQVLSSEQTRKRKGAVDDNVADADTDDTRKRRE
ncbi:uncharacterized protein [Temnothorax longispinosus]|uniref:uncharacterized protein isoform X2 n=1 Tax=Temnothorax longispinosus TaxID=300112 RepID=UPI003A999529